MASRLIMATIVAACLAFSGLSTVSAETLSPGDVLIGDYAGKSILQYSSTGTLKDTIAVGDPVVGLTLTPDRNIMVTTWGAQQQVRTYNTSGGLVSAYNFTPAGNPFGVDVSADGTIMVGGNNNNVCRRDSVSGAWTTTAVSTFEPSSQVLGLVASGTGYWWAADYSKNMLVKLTSPGAYVARYSTLSYRPVDVAVDPTDGTIWVSSDTGTGYVLHYNQNTGALISAPFAVDTGTNVGGIDVDLDGSIYVASMNGAGVSGKHVSHYSDTGVFLGSFALPTDSSPEFFAVVQQTPEPATMLLVGTGALGFFRYIRRKRAQ